MTDLTLSVLDLVPVRSDATSADAVAASRSLAQTADRLGYERFWVAEHHNMPAIASTNPPVLMGILAGATERIKVGSGGVMLPNHAPLVVAEQMALLEAAYPGRIDLGIGRAPGTDPVTSWALRHGGGGVTEDAVNQFPTYVEQIVAMMSPEGVGLQLSGRTHALRATPSATGSAQAWLLGSSDYSARLAAQLGLPYVFAHHFQGKGTAEALALYRQGWAAAGHEHAPRTFLTVNVCAAPTADEAHRRALPQALSMLTLMTGQPLTAQRTVEEAEEAYAALPQEHVSLVDAMRRRWLVGETSEVVDRLEAFATEHDVDEVMLHPVAGGFAGETPRQATGREQTLRLVAERVGSLAAA